MKTPLLLLFLVGALTTFGQDYVITQKNDTLTGTVKIFTYDVVDRVEVKEGKKKTQLTAMQVRAIVKDNATYNAVNANSNGIRFMKLMKSGYLSLYMALTTGMSAYETPYLVKRDGSTLEVPNLGFKKIMADYLDDCIPLREKLKSDQFGKKDLSDIIDQYNLCLDNQTKLGNMESSVALGDPKIVTLAALKTKVSQTSLASQKDLTDILNDVSGKVKSNESIPNYLLEGLKGLLKDTPEVKTELDNFLATLK